MNDVLQELLALIKANDGINDKARLARIVFDGFGLTKDRSVYYCPDFAIRFSSSASRNFGNTVLSLSNLRKYDGKRGKGQAFFEGLESWGVGCQECQLLGPSRWPPRPS